jgi:ATP-dependent helicase/nuclease subunit A
LDEPALTRAHCLDALQGLLAKLHRLKICTLDSYFSKLAGSFSLELGLPPGWRIIEELHDRRLRSESIETLLTDPQTSDLDRLIQMVTKGDADRSVSELISTTVGSLYKLYLQTDEQAWQRLPQLTTHGPIPSR